jgi:hypothetical protein
MENLRDQYLTDVSTLSHSDLVARLPFDLALRERHHYSLSSGGIGSICPGTMISHVSMHLENMQGIRAFQVHVVWKSKSNTND